MPSTINGIGTMYYGKKNREEYHGGCEYCGQPGVMLNYETRLWFTVLFIPVIPLGKKQILDYCARCTRHKSLKVADWERIKEEAVERSAQQLAENKDDPAAAVNVHATLAAFRRNDEADRLATIMREKFGDDAQVQLYLAGWYEGQHKPDEMRACIQRAQLIDPDNVAVRRAAGVTQIEDGLVDQARQTLKVMEPPSTDYDPTVFFLLAKGYQNQGEHAQALDVFQMILDASPKAGTQQEFRQAVKQSEKALARPHSILPHKPRFSKSAVAWTAILLLIAGGLLGWNRYVATHRTLHVVNGLAVPITVQITDADNQAVGEVEVAPQTGWAFPIAEGSYQAKVTAPEAIVKQSPPVDFTLATGWWSRFVKSPAYVIDPSRSAAVIWQQITYSVTPQIRAGNQDTLQLHVGKPLTTYDDLDFIFEPFPQEVNLTDRNKQEIRTGLGLQILPPGILPHQYPDQLTRTEWLDYLERHLGAAPTDQILLGTYGLLASQANELPRAAAFLKARLEERPVNVEWHRNYQQVGEMAGHVADLLAEYERYLAEDPKNSDLLYLRGRLCARASESLKYHTEAVERNDKNHWAWMSNGFTLLAQGQFDEAKDALDKAHALAPENLVIGELYWQARLATGDFAALEKELNPPEGQENNFPDVDRWRSILLAKARGKTDKIETAFKDLETNYPASLPPVVLNAVNHRKCQLLTLLERHEEAANVAAKLSPDQGVNAATRFEAFVLSGRLDEAEKESVSYRGAEEGYYHLALSLAYRLKGDAQKTHQWQDSGEKKLGKAGASEIYLAGLLTNAGQESPTDEELADVITSPRWKALVLCLLVEKSKESRKTQLLEQAERLNFAIDFPHSLIKQAVEEWEADQTNS